MLLTIMQNCFLNLIRLSEIRFVDTEVSAVCRKLASNNIGENDNVITKRRVQ